MEGPNAYPLGPTKHELILWHRLPPEANIHDVKVRVGVGHAWPLSWRTSRMSVRRTMATVEKHYRIAERMPSELRWREWESNWELVGVNSPPKLACVVYQLGKFARAGRPVHALWEVTRSGFHGDTIRVKAFVADWYMGVDVSVLTTRESPEGWTFRGPMTAYAHIDETV